MTQTRVIGAVVLLVVVGLLKWGLRTSREADVVVNPAAIVNNDPELKQAILDAQANVDQFLDRLNNPNGATEFAVQKLFVDGKKAEPLWLSGVKYDGRSFRGRITTKPEIVANVKKDETAYVMAAELLDWKYIDDGRLVGGYSIRLALTRLTPAEREKAVEELPYRLE